MKKANFILLTILNLGLNLNLINMHAMNLNELYDISVEKIQRTISNNNNNINTKDKYSNTLLISAVNAEFIDGIRFLLEKNANTEIENNRHLTALNFAIKRNNLDITKLLIESGANINKQNENGQTPLMLAIKESDPLDNSEIIKYLIKSKANLDLKDHKGRTALIYAIRRENINLIKILLFAGSNINTKDNNGITPLIESIFTNQINITRLLISLGADIDATDYDYNRNVLIYSAIRDNIPALSYFINKKDIGIDIDNQDKHGNTALIFAVYNGNVKSVNYLLKYNADTNIRNLNKDTALDIVNLKILEQFISINKGKKLLKQYLKIKKALILHNKCVLL